MIYARLSGKVDVLLAASFSNLPESFVVVKSFFLFYSVSFLYIQPTDLKLQRLKDWGGKTF